MGKPLKYKCPGKMGKALSEIEMLKVKKVKKDFVSNLRALCWVTLLAALCFSSACGAREAESQFQVCWSCAGILCSTTIILSLCFHREHAENGSEVETNTDKVCKKQEEGCKWEINDRNCSVQPNFLVMFQV